MKSGLCNETLKKEECVLCRENEPVHKYILDDGSSIDICDECGKIVYGKNIHPFYPDRLFHIIELMEYVKAYKMVNSSQVLTKKIK